jgi:transcription termination/antitermination protein NusA
MNSPDLIEALQALAVDKGISIDTLFGALADAFESAYKRLPNSQEYAWVIIDPDSGEIRVMAQALDDDGIPEGEEFDVTPPPEVWGRVAAQTMKQVMNQRIREAEREMKYEEYAGREGDIVTGIIQQTDARYTLLDLGRVEALMPQAEQVPYERPEPGARVKAYIVEVRKTAKGPQIVTSRTHPGLIKRLFELEVPKIAVLSNDSNVDPVGACVGARGARVRMVVNELRGEKIDIVPYSDEPADFVMKALSPAKVKEVRIHEDTGTAEVIVPDYQLSLAIGKEGQNARLAARLTGWRVDIKSETQLAEEEAYANQDWAEGEWVVDAESGEQVWQPAEGGEAMSAEAYAQAAEDLDENVAEAVAEAEVVVEAEAIVEAEEQVAEEESGSADPA